MAMFYRCCACKKEIQDSMFMLRVDRIKPQVDFDFCLECAKPMIALAEHLIAQGGAIQTVEAKPTLKPLGIAGLWRER